MSNTQTNKKNEATTASKGLTVAEGSAFMQLPTKSAKIRFLNAKGWSRGEIAKHMGIRYQHVRNVLITPVATPRVVA